jgi:beta-lactamase regulating signal transducer with metallopeptidase domain
VNLVDIVGWSLVHSLWEGAVIAVLLLVLLRVIDVRRAVVRYSAAVVALLLVVALPPITAVRTIRDPASVRNTSPSLDLQARASAEVSPGDEGLLKDPDPNPSPGRHEQLKSSKAGGAVSENAFVTTIQPRLRSAFPWLVAFWIAGVILLSIRLFSAWLGAQRLKIQGISPAEPSHQDALDRLQAKLGVIRPIRLLQSAIVQVPAVIGWMRPVILLPASLATGLTIAQLEAILAHELAHVRRHDYLVNLLQAVIETLLFYHPAVWWISRQVRKERENCCDDLAVHACGDVRQYAGALLTLEEHRAMRLVPAATGGDLLARIRRLAAPRLSHAETSSRWLAGLIAIAAVLLLAGSAAFFDPYRNALVAQDRAPQFAPQDAAVGPDTVIRHPNPSAPLPERWGWARQLAATQRFPAFWIGYTIDPMPGIDGMIYVGRLERKGITGSGGLNLRGRITSFGNNFGNFEGFRVPGVMLPPLVGGGMPDDVAMLFAFVLDDRGRPGLARVHISSLALPVDLQDRPLLWLGDAVDEESIALVQTLYQPATTDLKPDVVAAMGVHGSKAAVPHLSRWLESGDATAVREEAAEWLGRHPDPAALSLLARTARADQVSDVRREAAEAVAEMKLPAATDTLIGLARGLNDNDARREAVEGLAEKSDPRAMAAALEIARNDRDIDLRREAVETLGEFKNGAGVPHLIELARTDRAPDVRSEAVETLGEAAPLTWRSRT